MSSHEASLFLFSVANQLLKVHLAINASFTGYISHSYHSRCILGLDANAAGPSPLPSSAGCALPPPPSLLVPPSRLWIVVSLHRDALARHPPQGFCPSRSLAASSTYPMLSSFRLYTGIGRCTSALRWPKVAHASLALTWTPRLRIPVPTYGPPRVDKGKGKAPIQEEAMSVNVDGAVDIAIDAGERTFSTTVFSSLRAHRLHAFAPHLRHRRCLESLRCCRPASGLVFRWGARNGFGEKYAGGGYSVTASTGARVYTASTSKPSTTTRPARPLDCHHTTHRTPHLRYTRPHLRPTCRRISSAALRRPAPTLRPLAEPASTSPRPPSQALRSSPTCTPLAPSSPFQGTAFLAGFLPDSNRIILDTHPYFAFDGAPNNAPIATSRDPPCRPAGRGRRRRSAFGVTVSGEFSNGYKDFRLYLTGVNGTQSYGGDCSLWFDASTWNDTTKAGVKQFALPTMDATQDWFFWTWKTGPAADGVFHPPPGSYSLGLKKGFMPIHPRHSHSVCAALKIDA
ncbi:hypothetical protein B0H14DRAFT_3882991 [Mycena olivaceomarginata]|nr:hypothetical protein B0H14DRAFT_3882991 [Mycena olivaceomarginata]